MIQTKDCKAFTLMLTLNPYFPYYHQNVSSQILAMKGSPEQLLHPKLSEPQAMGQGESFKS